MDHRLRVIARPGLREDVLAIAAGERRKAREDLTQMAPKPNTSLRSSTRSTSPRACSGGM